MAKEKTFNALFSSIKEAIIASGSKHSDRWCGMLDAYKQKFFSTYREINYYVKSNFMEDTTAPLDRHKCSACFMIAAMMSFKTAEQSLEREAMAICIGLTVLRTFINDKRDSSDAALSAFLDKRNGSFVMPDCICDEHNFIKNWASEIHWAYKQYEFVLSLANELFLIETFNKKELEIEILKQGDSK
ncbi:MAG: hypothetical protein FWF51_02500 [Chitinivibrionia bacterium]|nr:hypothetical protein [Chitinivibrionia bacterium]